MADAVHFPPEKRLLDTPYHYFLVSASVLIRGGYLSYRKSVFVLQIQTDLEPNDSTLDVSFECVVLSTMITEHQRGILSKKWQLIRTFPDLFGG